MSVGSETARPRMDAVRYDPAMSFSIGRAVVPSLALILATTHAGAGKPKVSPPTTAIGHDPAGHSQMLISCTPAGADKVTCTHSQTMLELPPSAEKIEEEIAEMTAALKAMPKAKLKEDCKKSLPAAEKETTSEEPATAQMAKAVVAMCKSLEVEPYIKVRAFLTRKYNAHTCSMRIVSAIDRTYTRVDDDTWVSTDSPSGVCLRDPLGSFLKRT